MHRTLQAGLFAAGMVLVLAAPAGAKGAHRYAFRCQGLDNLARPAGAAGIIKLTTQTNAIGDVQLNLSSGAITTRTSFTATFVNGTAGADGSGGNGIPTGCFTAALAIPGDTWGLMSNLFGCYTKNLGGFYAAQSSGGAQVTCEAGEM